MRTEITYREDKLYINVEGMVNLSHMDRMKQKLDYIMREYPVKEIELNHEKAIGCSKKYWNDYIEPFEQEYRQVEIRMKR